MYWKCKKGKYVRQRLDHRWSSVQSQCTIIAHWHRPITSSCLDTSHSTCSSGVNRTHGLVDLVEQCAFSTSFTTLALSDLLTLGHRHRFLLLDGNLLGDPIYIWKHQLYFNIIENAKLRLWNRTVNLVTHFLPLSSTPERYVETTDTAHGSVSGD
jgi:hypothetical protein